MKGSLVLVISALGLFFGGCATNNSSRPQPISGAVEDSQGQPIAGMPVDCYSYSVKWAHPPEFKLLSRTTTDARGAFHFSAEAEYVFLLAHRDGVAPAWRLNITRPPHQTERLICQQTASIAGIVVDEAGKPVADANVSVVQARTTFQLAEGQVASDELSGTLARQLYSTRSSADGHFTINGLPQNASIVLVAETSGEAFLQPPLKSDPTRGGLDPFSAGQQDVKLVMEPGAIIQGRLIAQEDGQPLAGINLWLRSNRPLHSSDEGSQMVMTASDGSFRFTDVPAGEFFFHPDFPGDTPARLCKRVPVSVGTGQTTNVTVFTTLGGMLEAKVMDSKSHRPLAGVGISAQNTNFFSDGGTDKRGTALIRLLPGDYNVIAGKANWSVGFSKSHIESGKTNQLQFALEPPVKVTGVLSDASGAPVSGVRVCIYPETSGADPTHTDAKGKFEIIWNPHRFGATDIGDYALLARDWQRNLALAITCNPSFKTVDLHLQPALTISGIVKNEQGHPITNATIKISLDVRNTSSDVDRQSISTDANGRYKISVLPPAQKYSLLFMAPGYTWLPLQLSPEETATNQLELSPAILKAAADPQHPWPWWHP